MSKFNTGATRTAVTSPIQTERTPTGHTHEGAPGYARTSKSELFLLAVANMVGEKTFYEQAGDRDERFETLVREVTRQDPAWMLDFVRWLRTDGNMRSASLVAACQAVKERTEHYAAVEQAAATGDHGVQSIRMSDPFVDAPTSFSRAIIDAAIRRADEPGELLAYWTSTFGRRIPKPVKRGVADAVQRLYNERNLLKYDTASHGFRFGDVVDLVHPAPHADKPWQGDLFKFALDRRHNRENGIPERLTMLRRNALLRAEVAEDPSALLNPQLLADAGMTWEDALSLAGNRVDKAKLWEAMIPSMGIMARARNLRNFDEAGVPDSAVAAVISQFSDPAEVAKSRMFPFRWLAAYRHAPSLRWGHALELALTASLANVPALSGRTLVLVDVSGSMGAPAGGALSDMSRMDVAAVFGSALALRAADATLVAFDTTATTVSVPRGGSLLRLVEAIPRRGGGTNTEIAVRQHYRGHDRVVIVTDEQAAYSGYGNVAASVPANVPVYTWNLAGYRHGHAPSGSGQRHTFGGLSDAAWRLIPLLESGRDGAWPWQVQG